MDIRLDGWTSVKRFMRTKSAALRERWRVRTSSDSAAMQGREEQRRQELEDVENSMSDAQYREHLEDEYGTDRWAGKVTDELMREHQERFAEREGAHRSKKP